MTRPTPVPAGPARARARLSPRTLTLALSLLVTVGLLAVMAALPVPYVVQGPGPTFNTLGQVPAADGEMKDLITIEGAPSYSDDDGELRLTTVVAGGGPGYPMGIGNVVRGWLSPTETVVPREAVYPDDVTPEQSQQESQAQMSQSQQAATVEALTATGHPVPAVLKVIGVSPGSGAEGVVEPGDTLTSVTGGDGVTREITTYADLADTLAATKPGTSIGLGVDRGGQPVPLTLVTGDDGFGGSLLGVSLDPTFTFPIQVHVEIDNVGGPSAGTMFALGIIDKLTPGSMTGGKIIAGTGTMSLTGRVGPIGGILQKMNGAVRDGAEYFLAPGRNCQDVVGNIPKGLTVVRIDTLDDAVAAVTAIGAGDVSGLPSCS